MPKNYPKDVRNVRVIARHHTASMIRVLAKIATSPRASYPARVAAAVALLDRGWGRPAQTLQSADDGELRITVRQIIEGTATVVDDPNDPVSVGTALLTQTRPFEDDFDEEGDA